MRRLYKCGDVFRRYEDGKAPEGAVLVEVAEKGVTPETPKKRATRTRKPKAETQE